MPTDVAIAIVGIVAVFAGFALVLAWASYYTRDYHAPDSKHF